MDWESVGWERMHDGRFDALFYKPVKSGIASQIGMYVAFKRGSDEQNAWVPDFEDSARSERLDKLAEHYAKL